MEWILAGLAFGFLGSFHCVGMCGPIALALPGSFTEHIPFAVSRLIYNSGRVVTYTALGALAGLFSRIVSIGGYQQGLSIAVGLILLLLPAWRKLRALFERTDSFSGPRKLAANITVQIKNLFGSDSFGSLFLIGLLNGLLPCGFVYMALATAATSGGVAPSLLFMAAFGLGTIPAMLGVSLAGNLIPLTFRQKLQSFSPYFIAIMGIILILRGLNLGIPFISPVI